MADADGKVIIAIDADSSNFEKGLEEINSTAVSAAAAIEKKTVATTKDTVANKQNSESMEAVARRATEAGTSVSGLGDKSRETGNSTDALRDKYDGLSAKVSATGKTVELFDTRLSLNDAQLKGNGDSVSTLKERQSLLQEAVTASKNKIQLLGEQLSVASELFGENSDEVAGLKIKLAEAQAEEQKLSNELKDATAAIRNKTDALQALSKKLKDAGESATNAGEKISGIGSSLTKGITVPVTAAATAAIKLGSDYEENLNKVDASFKQNAGEVERWAKSATKNFGLSESKALEVTSQFGDMGTSMGLSTAAAAEMSTSLAGLAGDLSSFKNIDIDQAMTALNGVFTGETESLKTLGVVMTETNLKQFASDCGLVYDGMSQAEKVTLRYKFVLAMTKNAQGDYKATSDGTANSLRTLQSSVSNLGASFGQKLLPKITPVIQGMTDLVDRFGELDDSTQNAIIKAALVAAAVGPVTTAVGKTTSGIGNLLTVAGKVVSASSRFSSALTGTGAAAVEAAAGVSTATTATGGLGSAITAALGTGGAAALAVAGTAAVTAGAIALGTAIHNATDPVIQLKKHLEEFSTAQDNVGKADNIIDLANRYEELRSKLQDTTLSATEIADVQAELDGIRQSLNEATNGAITLEGDYSDTLDDTVAHQKELAEIEKQRSTAEIYSSLVAGAKDYKNALEEQGTVQDQLEKAKTRLTTAENDLESAMATVTSGTEKNRLATIRDNMALDNAVLSADGARDSYNKLQDQMTELQGITSAYENEVIGLVQDGFLSAEDGASLLGISVERLGRKMTTYWNNAHKAETATSSLAEEHLDAAEAAKEQQSAEEEATKSLASVGAEAYNAINAGGDLRELYEELSKEAEKYTENADEQIAADTELALQRLNLAATTQELGTAYGDMSQTIGLSTAELAGYLVSADMSFEDFQSNATTATSNVINGFEKVTTSLEMSLSTMQSNLEYNIQAQASWNDNMETLWNRAVASGDAGTMALVQKLYDMGVEGAAQVAEFVNLTDEELAEWGGLFAEAGQEGAENAALGAAMAAGSLYNSGAAMGAEFGEGYASTDMSRPSAGLVDDAASGITSGKSKLTASGKNVGAAIVTGLKSQEASLKTSAASLAAAAINVWTAKASSFRVTGANAIGQLVDGITSRRASVQQAATALTESVLFVWRGQNASFQSTGAAAAAALATGISGGRSGASGAASGVIYAVQSAMQIGGWYSLGYNISAGVASGVRGGSGLISAAARSAAQSALSTAKRALGVHSPSRVFRDEVGQMIPAGLAEGIAIGTPKATREVELTADQLLMATQVALRPSGSMMGAQYISNTTSNSYYGSTGSEAVAVEVPVYLDGREIARASTKYTGRRMAYLEGL